MEEMNVWVSKWLQKPAEVPCVRGHLSNSQVSCYRMVAFCNLRPQGKRQKEPRPLS